MKSKQSHKLFITFALAAIFVILSAIPNFVEAQNRQLTKPANSDKDKTKRVALVIGNGDYTNARKLSNPVNDATDIAKTLKELDFEVISGTNLNLKQMTDKVREFGDKLKTSGGVGLFYYAGHGIQVGGRNYLIPVEADILREDEVAFRLFQTKKFTVIERQLLNKIIAEQKLSLTGIIDPASAQKLGKLLGVDAIATGSISDLTKTIEINARLVSTQTGEVFSAASTEILKDETVCNLMGGCDNSANSNTQTPKQPSKPNSMKPKSWIVESSFFTFELHICKLSGTTVICEFTVTNNDKDRELIFGGGGGKLFDEYNNSSNAVAAELANSGKDSYSRAFLINGIATKARVYFENVSPNSKKIALMGVYTKPEGGNEFYIQYRNIPLGENAATGNVESKDDSNYFSYQYSQKKQFRIYPNSKVVDSGVDVLPCGKVEVTVSGILTRKIDNSAVENIIGGIFKRRINVPPTIQKIDSTALLSVIKFPSGKVSETVSVGTSRVFTVSGEEIGRLYFGVDDKYSASSGYFDVTLKW